MPDLVNTEESVSISPQFSQLLGEDGAVVTFERFMETALYHPKSGYYSSNICTVGRRGDFSTSATMHTALGRAVAAWALKEKGDVLKSGGLGGWNVIEIGAGDGSLARSFIDSLGWMARKRLKFHIVESSAVLTKHQKKNLRKYDITWHENPASAMKATGGVALIYSNELVDAFPAVRVEWDKTAGEWKELCLRITDSRFEETLCEIPSDRLKQLSATSRVMGSWGVEYLPEDGQRCEIQHSYSQWLSDWLPAFQQGSILSIDYGGAFPDLYERRPAGTARSYFQQLRFEGLEVYDRAGNQDITCDVNFSDVAQWGEKLGVSQVSLASQQEFMKEMIPKEVAQCGDGSDPALEFLMSPYGAGSAFKVLRQRKVAQ